MLDTNICIYAVKNNPQVLDKLAEHLEDELCISSIVKSEIEYGICKSAAPEKNRQAFKNFLQDIAVLPYDKKAAKDFGSDVNLFLTKLKILVLL